MAIPGNLLTTAMAVMPHTDVQRELATALSLDIPFWPQLPDYSYAEGMYVQASEHFPGIFQIGYARPHEKDEQPDEKDVNKCAKATDER